MTKQQAVWLLHGIYWTNGEGQGTDEMYAAAKALIEHFGITVEDCKLADASGEGFGDCLQGYWIAMQGPNTE